MAATRPPQRLPLGVRCWLRAKHTVRLGREVGHVASSQGTWWLVPVVVLLLVVAAVVTTTSTAIPVAVYTLF